MEQEITDLYKQLNTELLRWCCIMTQDEDMARELVQEGFLRAIDHYDEIEGLTFQQKRAWLYRTIKNVFIDTVRKRKNECLQGKLTDSEELPMQQSFYDKYSEKEILEVLKTMDVLEAKLLILRHVEGFSSKQIGEMLGLPPGTVRSKLHEAREHLKKKII
ncbi:RNA polymerase sigma factor [Butyrivibrio sp. AE3009]|uniref:RNA polymerase sigma factor n=1 Tax=Butyrivibrio sp. AE3009 TaxID=1280666 RepID=UPI00047BE7AE|nr:RNA polymerase sigma factor [Butyrivibrio sp. AE3009]